MSEVKFVMARGSFPDLSVEEEYLAGKAATVRIAPLATAEQVASASDDADGLIVTTEPLPREFIEQIHPKVRIIGRAGIGLDAIDLDAARERGIAVFHTPDYATEEVATHTIAMILAVNRKIVEGDAVARRDWMAWDTLAPVAPLSEQVVGVVGLGRIGRAVVERLVPFSPKIIAFDPYAQSIPPGATAVAELGELLQAADVVSLHVPLTPETAGIIGERELGLLRPGAVIINVARGALIDEEALVAALSLGRLHAALDVLAAEPPAQDTAILSAPHVLLSPHFAWYSDASDRRVRTETLQGMLDYLYERPLTTGRLVVDPRA
jgi:D-3-phosphoglycerate dehydrogenase / 2-oxoglutarate reductase